MGIRAPKSKADLVLVSHDHFDHNCSKAVSGPDTCVISEPVMTVEKGVRIEGLTASHDTEGGSRRGKVTIFKFEMDGFSFCHLGDLGHDLDESMIERLGSLDFLFLPVGDVFTIGPQTAFKVARDVGSKVAIPMHYRVPGLGLSIQPVQNFLKLCDPKSVVKVGNEIDFAAEDLPRQGTEFWVFSL